MSKEKFTKGEWRYQHDTNTRMCGDSSNDHKILAMHEDCEFRIASINVFESEDIANAQLIAQAPNMYKELQNVSELLSAMHEMPTDWTIERSVKIKQDIEKLLSAARGE